MTRDLESELREALAARAATAPEPYADQLARTASRPRPRRLTYASIGTLATGGAVAALVLALTGPGVGSAYASWTPTPSAASASQAATAESTCESTVLADAGSADSSDPGGLYIQTAADWTANITDVRGSYVLVGLTAASGTTTDMATCLISSDASTAPVVILSARGETTTASGQMEQTSGGWASGMSGAVRSSAGGRSLTVSGGASSATTSIGGPLVMAIDASASFILGTAASDVTAVSLQLSDGSSVTASVENGYYAAWWPGSAVAQSAEVTSPTGTTTVSLGGPPAPNGPSGTSGSANSVVQN